MKYFFKVTLFVFLLWCRESLGTSIFDSKQTAKLELLKKLCQNKTDNFCSQESMAYMFKVMKLEQEKDQDDSDKKKKQDVENNKRIVETVNREIKQAKLAKFVKWYPRYKMMMKFFPDRFF